MEEQTNLKEDVLQDVTLQNELKAIKEALEMQRLKEELISRILLEDRRKVLKSIDALLNPICSIPEKEPAKPSVQGDR
jgi:hypothetical protein